MTVTQYYCFPYDDGDDDDDGGGIDEFEY